MIAIVAIVSATAMGCLIDFGGYQTAPDASAGGGDDGGLGGAAGAASGGAAGASGGAAGSSGTSGSGGAQAGSGGAQAGSGGAQAGSGGAQAGSGGAAVGGAAGSAGGSGSGGQAGAGGAACTFDACQVNTTAPPDGCNACTQAVCQTMSFCCSGAWSYECMIEARANSACGCAAGLGCSGTWPTPVSGSCATGQSCNPVTGGGCGGSQCVLNLTSGQPKYECQLLGTQGACDFCEPTQSKNCVAGLSCLANRCVKVCCGNPDCPQGTVCNMSVLPGTVGLCMEP